MCPMTATDITGDGKTAPLVMSSVELPDSGTAVLVSGQIQSPGNPTQAITGSPLVMPVAPGSGVIYWNVQVNTLTGAATIAQSPNADPPAAANTLIVFRQTLGVGATDPALVATDTTPDSW